MRKVVILMNLHLAREFVSEIIVLSKSYHPALLLCAFYDYLFCVNINLYGNKDNRLKNKTEFRHVRECLILLLLFEL